VSGWRRRSPPRWHPRRSHRTLSPPHIALVVLIALFGAYALVDGVFAIVSAVRAAERHMRWWPLLVEGLAGIVVGVLTFVWPGLTALVLLYFIASWAILTGVFEILAAVRLRREITGEWLLGLTGVLSVVFGLLLIIVPGAGALTVVWLIGTYALVFGVVLVGLALRLRGRSQERISQVTWAWRRPLGLRWAHRQGLR
jgi:uncharacterized membrane protein HdeD (DUF308 family)